MAPAIASLQHALHEFATVEAETPAETSFLATTLPRLHEAAEAFYQPQELDPAHPERCWTPVKEQLLALGAVVKRARYRMADVSPTLAALRGSLVPVPPCTDGEAAAWWSEGGGAGGPTIVEVGAELAALPTKTRPKRLAVLASDGRWLTFLLKGREDLRMEARVMQVGGGGGMRKMLTTCDL